MSLFVSATVAPWSQKYLTKQTKQGLREALKDHADVLEFNVIPTPVSRGGVATLREFPVNGIAEVTVRSADHTKIIGVIVPRVVDGDVVAVVK